jgi:glyoxylase-like metal-dependent hydrolase (beta-lactamase superfamily II)
LKIHKLKGYIQNIYLIEENNQLMLLDGCCRCDVKIIQQFITQNLNRPFKDLKAIIVTHMHPDHAGAAQKLRKLTACKIYSSKTNKHWYNGIVGKVMFLTDLVLTWYVAKRIGKSLKYIFYSPHMRADLQLEDLDTIPEFPNWQIIYTAGHTDRDISVYHSATQTIYVADLVIKTNSRLIAPFPIFHPNKYKASLERVDSLPIKKLLMAHGAIMDKTRIKLTEEIHSIPQKPKTHWRATRIKIQKLIERF